jgi:hypothetical protein
VKSLKESDPEIRSWWHRQVALFTTRARTDNSVTHLLRSLEEARKTADAAVNVAETFFDSGYGNRDTAPALINEGLRHAVSIASRMTKAAETNKFVDCSALEDRQPIQSLSGIDFLLMTVPAIELALRLAPANSTVRVVGEQLARLESAMSDRRFKNHLWINRRNAVISQPGISISIATSAVPLTRSHAEAWLRGEETPFATVAARGLISGIQKSKGLLALAVSPQTGPFRIVLALPT